MKNLQGSFSRRQTKKAWNEKIWKESQFSKDIAMDRHADIHKTLFKSGQQNLVPCVHQNVTSTWTNLQLTCIFMEKLSSIVVFLLE